MNKTTLVNLIMDENFVMIVNDYNGLKKIPIKMLEAVFPPKEIEALFAKAKNEKPIRQYLYRARKRYDYFEELFDIRLEL